MPTQFEGLYIDHEATPKGAKSDEILDHEHRLVQSAIRWVRQTRYSKDDDHRLAARLIEDIDQADLIATFIATIRAGDNTEMEQVMAIRVSADGSIDEDDASTLLYQKGVGNVPPDCIPGLFDSWWKSAVETADGQATQLAERWQSSVKQLRFTEQGELKRQFDVWAQATRSAITAGYETQQRVLPGMESPLPPTVLRRLKEHGKEVDGYTSFLNRRLQFDAPNIEPLGVLLRVPAKEVR